MLLRRLTYCIIALAILTACNKAPDDVISESTMARLMVDLNKAEYYVETHQGEFPDDSTRMALKQSIFARHGVDQELYDHSLEWYGRNMDVYTDVCDRALRQLEDEKKHIAKRMENEPDKPLHNNLRKLQTQSSASNSDTVDVWNGNRSWMLTAGMRQGALRWDIEPAEHQPGDKYMLHARVASNGRGMTATLACDYTDGTTSTITRPMASADWNAITLQTDTTRQLRRIYGYIRFDMQPQTVAIIDSISLMRTPLDRYTYGIIGSQQTIHRRGNHEAATLTPQHAMPDAQQHRDQADDRARAATPRTLRPLHTDKHHR